MIADAESRDADERLARASSLSAYLPWLLVYPLRGYGPGLMLMAAAFVALGGESPFGIPLLAITAIWLLHYLMSVVTASSSGRALPPPLKAEVVFLDGLSVARALLGPALVLSGFYALREQGQGGAATALLAGAGFLAPAHLFVLAHEGSARRALNPLVLARTVAGFGLSYLLPASLFAGATMLAPALPAGLGAGGYAAVLVYLALLVAHGLGVAAYRRHDALDLPGVIVAPQQRDAAAQRERQLELLMLRLEAHLRAGDREGAVAALQVEVEPAHRRYFHEALFERLQLKGEARLLQAQGQQLISVLLAERRDPRALEVFETCLAAGSAFLPATAADLVRLAQAAAAAGQDARLEQLWRRGLQALGVSPEAPGGEPAAVSLQLLLARRRADRGDDAGARGYLKPLLACREHPDYPAIQALARVVAGPRGEDSR